MKARPSSSQMLEDLIRRAPPTFTAQFIEEPRLLFGGNQISVDPKTGIELYGPASTAKPKINIGIIGTGSGISDFSNYISVAHQAIVPGLNARGRQYDPRAFPDFPGISPDVGFRTVFATTSNYHRVITDEQFRWAVSPVKTEEKLRRVVMLVAKELDALSELDPAPDVVALVMPSDVEKDCATVGRSFASRLVKLTPAQKLKQVLERKRSKTGQGYFEFDLNDEPTSGQNAYWNLHNALKGHAMKSGLPTQMIWQSRLHGGGVTQDPASMAWNIFTALFYKGGNIPWQLQQLPVGTCFVGVAFYKDRPYGKSNVLTSLAQAFSGAGEGLVLKGGPAEINRDLDRQPHLTGRDAEDLLVKVIDLYEKHHLTKPTRVVIHKTSKYFPDELAGFKKALGSIPRYDFLAIEKLDFKFMRIGKEPPLRGTVVSLGPKEHLVYTVGYVPHLNVYPGSHIPVPLHVVEHHGDSPSEQICREILALTKLNWNSCAFACSEPITLQFARNVGRVLTEIPVGVKPQTKYKFYM